MNDVMTKEYLSSLRELISWAKQHPEDKTSGSKIGQICWELGDRKTAEKLFNSYGDNDRHRIEIQGIIPDEQNSELLLNYAIETPPGSQVEVGAIDVKGWIVGRKSPAVSIELLHEGRVIAKTPVCVPRTDVAEHYPEAKGVRNCGFRVMVGMLGMPYEFELLVQAVFKGEERLHLATFRVQHRPLRSDFQPALRPLMLTSLGRMGTTWVMRLLAGNSQIVAHRSYPYEARIAGYCMFMLKVLSESVNLIQSANPDTSLSGFFGIIHPGHIRALGYADFDYQIVHRFEQIYAEQMAASFQRSIEEFYRQVAINQGRTEPVYFAEKMFPGDIPCQIWELYSQAREIILVRDFRDMICSVLSFNKKRGFVDFGRQCVINDEEYIKQSVRSDALRLLKSWRQRAAKAYLLRYEDLILNPRETLSALLGYLGLDNTPSTVRNILQMASEDTSALRYHRTTLDPMTSIGRWKRDLSPEMQTLCNESLGEILQEFGYSLEAEYGYGDQAC